ncbi:MAG: hypothetical protein WA118_08390 [Carboxydocellales bacterium]
MSNAQQQININEEDAFNYIIRYLNEGTKSGYSNYGYGLYLPNVMHNYLVLITGVNSNETDRYFKDISPAFYNAAWELCRRGLLRPGITTHGLQATSDGSAGNGYSITPKGKAWLEEAGKYDYVPIEPGRFARLLDKYGDWFGPSFRERCQEAIRCYGAHAYLACCAMCGAAAESIILALAIAKSGNEERVLKDYASAGGRGRIENLIIGKQPNGIQAEFRGYSSLLKYWRDTAAHGKISNITDNEAYTSLAFLLRFALFTSEKWDTLIQP